MKFKQLKEYTKSDIWQRFGELKVEINVYNTNGNVLDDELGNKLADILAQAAMRGLDEVAIELEDLTFKTKGGVN